MGVLTSNEKKTSRSTSLSKNQLNEAIKEECHILQSLVKAKHALEWMTENKFLIPQKLMEDIQDYEKQAKSASQQLQAVINDWDTRKN
jgi:hypothetical protein